MATELLEFWATGCRQSLPCHRAVERLQTVNDIGMVVRSIDAWDAPVEVATHRVLRLPTLLLLVDGVERARCSPARVSPAVINGWVLGHLPDTTPATPHASTDAWAASSSAQA